jgi:elongation factor P--(R)-beta-lysine ligase
MARTKLLAQRHRAKAAVRAFFETRDFLEVDTPSVVICPGLDAHVHSLGRVEGTKPPSYLITSPELHMKRLLASGHSRIYQLAHCFRAEELGTWHEPEFLMLEWYEAGATFDNLLAQTEELVRAVALTLEPRGILSRADAPFVANVNEPFLRLTIPEAFREFAGVGDVVDLARTNAGRYFELLIDKVEPGLARLGRPVALTHYPLSQAGLARASASSPGLAERFELYAAGIELCNGFAELTDPIEQRRRFLAEQERRREANEPLYPIDEDFMAALERGMPEAVGNALGFDRLIALALGANGIADIVSFPRFQQTD